MSADHDRQPERRARPQPEESCPICGGALVRIHGTSRCRRCHQIIDTCCEGAPPVPSKIESEKNPPAGKP